MARRRYQKGSVYQRGGLWYGRYYERVILADGTEGKVRRNEPLGECKTEKMALRALEPILAKINANVHRPIRYCSWAEFSERWQQTMIQNYKPSVWAAMKSPFRSLAHFNKLKVPDISTWHIQDFVAKQKCAAKTVRNRVDVMRSMWKQARAWSFAQHNPFDGLVLPKVERVEEPAFSAHDVRRIIAAAPPPYDLAFWLLAETGIRRGELCGLDVGDVDLAMTTITVRRSRWRNHLTSPKSRHERRFPISDVLSAALAEHIAVRKDGPLFLNRLNRRVHPEVMHELVLKPILKKLGLKGAFHAFRHGNITEMARQRIQPAIMQQRVGHAHFETTMGYQHVVSEDARAAANALGRLYAALPEAKGEA